jgi:hypothetical protein
MGGGRRPRDSSTEGSVDYLKAQALKLILLSLADPPLSRLSSEAERFKEIWEEVHGERPQRDARHRL